MYSTKSPCLASGAALVSIKHVGGTRRISSGVEHTLQRARRDITCTKENKTIVHAKVHFLARVTVSVHSVEYAPGGWAHAGIIAKYNKNMPVSTILPIKEIIA